VAACWDGEARRKHLRAAHGSVVASVASAGGERLVGHPVCDLGAPVDHFDGEQWRGGHVCPRLTTPEQKLSE
jgi:hypothetical protein